MKKESYFTERDELNISKIREILKFDLPDFCEDFFMGIESYTSPLTRLGYARDLKTFFQYLTNETNDFGSLEVKELTLSDLDTITATHIERYLHYLTFYTYNGKKLKNGEKARSRKLSAVRALLKYYFKKDKIKSNVADKIDTPKIHEGEIIRLDVDEVVKLLNESEQGTGFSQQQRKYLKNTQARDFAMLSLFLGTGIRISECVGLDIDDIDFEENAFRITRKGGNKSVLYFNDEVKDALIEWLKVRERIKELPRTEKALFVSLQNRRISVRAVENLVKKYSKNITLKHITPHKLRSTFGTNLYRETNDIYVVANVLGHKDVNTTRKHYAALGEDIKRQAASKVKLRGE